MLRRSHILRLVTCCFVLSATALSAQSSSQTRMYQRFPSLTNSRRPTKPLPPQVAYMPTGRFKLLDSSTGWVVAYNSRLLWTTDGGAHWKDISPPNPNHDHYADVFFMDDVTGWVLFSHQVNDRNDPIPHNYEGDWTFYVASTQDAGKTWAITNIPAMAENHGAMLGGSGQIAFGDSLNGWIEVEHHLSGSLLHTTDGGHHWAWVKNAPGLLGTITAISANHLFYFGRGPLGDQYFYASWDAGQTFSAISFKPSIRSAAVSSYSMPVFQGPRSGYEAVTYSRDPNTPSVAVLFETSDAGHTWHPSETLTNLGIGSRRILSTVTDSTWVVPFMPYRGSMSLIKLPISGGQIAAPQHQTGDFDRCKLNFWGSTYGWSSCESGGGLSATDDGGTTWNVINPKAVLGTGTLTDTPLTPTPTIHPSLPPTNVPPHWKPVPRQQASAPLSTAASGLPSGVSQQLGFDITKVPTTVTMQDWWNDSPYYDIGIYLPNSPNRSVDPNLGTDWVSAVHTQGWGIIPIWFGLQAVCVVDSTNITQFISSTPSDAYAQGISQAASAEANVTSLGLDGSVIYLDIENYNPTTCGQAVEAYVYGFITQLHSDGICVGVYSSIFDAQQMYSACYNDECNSPDYFWFEREDYRVTVWNADHGYSGDLPDSYWPDRARMHQYAINQNHTWDGLELQIDEDIVDSTIVGGTPSLKPLNINSVPTTVTYQSDPTVIAAIANGANDSKNTPAFTQGNLVGCAAYNYGYLPFERIDGTYQALQYPPSIWACPAGINDQGTVVGYTLPPPGADGTVDGIIWSSPGDYTTFDDPNASWTELLSINDAGWITGAIVDDSGNFHCILVKPVNGNYSGSTPIEFDEAGGNCENAAINGIGIIGGNYILSDFTFSAFVDDVENGAPGSGVSLYSNQAIDGVNNNGLAAGPDCNFCGGSYVGSLFTSAWYDFPTSTTVYGLNDDPEIVGEDSGTGQPGVIYDADY